MGIGLTFFRMRRRSQSILLWIRRMIALLASVRTSQSRNVFTTKHPTSVIMLGVVASNREKMPPVWFPCGYRPTAPAYKDVLVTKILPWVRKITMNENYVFQQDGAPAHIAKNCSKVAGIKHELLAQWLLAATVSWPEPLRLQRLDAYWEQGL